MSTRLINRQRARNVLMAVFPELQFRSRIRDYLFQQFGDKFQPEVGEVVAAWTTDARVVEYDRYESGGNGAFIVGGVAFTNIRPLRAGER